MLNKLTTWLSGIALLCISLSLFSQEKKEIKLENYFGDLSARQIGPAVMSGRISDMENHPTDPKSRTRAWQILSKGTRTYHGRDKGRHSGQ